MTTVIGCGAQAKYVWKNHWLTDQQFKIGQVMDPIGGKIGLEFRGLKIIPYDINKILRSEQIFLAVPDNRLKKKIYEDLLRKHCVIANAIHHTSKGDFFHGCIVNSNVVVEPDTEIGFCCMIHSNVVIDHDCKIGDFVNIGSGVNLAGGVVIEECATIWTGATIVANVKIGKNSIIGAGSVVMKDVPDNVIAYGSPAKVMRKVK